MQTLKRGSRGEAVRLWQARVGAKVDGVFGNKTKALTQVFQLHHGLYPDGAVGPITQKAAGFVKTKYQNLYVLKIPFTAIIDADVLLEDKAKRQTVDCYSKDYPVYDMFLNAGLFDMVTGANTTDVVIDGKLNNGGNYTNIGLSFRNNKIVPAHTADIVGKIDTDFLGGGPNLITNGATSIDMRGIGASLYTSSTQRMAFGIDEEAFYIITTGRTKKATLSTVLKEGLYQGIDALVGADGGGSVALDWNGLVFSAGRRVPTTIALQLGKDW